MTESGAQARPADLGAAVDSAQLLRREIRGLEILECDLVLATGTVERRAEWIGVDRDGRLVVCLSAAGSDDDVLVALLDACASAGEMRAPAAKHWPRAHIRPDVEPVVVLVAGAFSTRVLGALAQIRQGAVLAFELRAFETARGREDYLVRREFEPGGLAQATPRDVLALWPEPAREHARRLIGLVQRIDPEIECRAAANALCFGFHGRDLAELACTDGVLRQDAAGTGDVLAYGDAESQDAWLEQALSAWTARRQELGTVARPLDLHRRNAGPLLTPEELAAFRE